MLIGELSWSASPTTTWLVFGNPALNAHEHLSHLQVRLRPSRFQSHFGLTRQQY